MAEIFLPCRKAGSLAHFFSRLCCNHLPSEARALSKKTLKMTAESWRAGTPKREGLVTLVAVQILCRALWRFCTGSINCPIWSVSAVWGTGNLCMTTRIEPASVGDIPVASQPGSSKSPISPPQRWQCLLFPLWQLPSMLAAIQVSLLT